MSDSDSEIDDMNGSIKTSASMTQRDPAPWDPVIVRDSQIPVANVMELDFECDEDEIFAVVEEEPFAVKVAVEEYTQFRDECAAAAASKVLPSDAPTSDASTRDASTRDASTSDASAIHDALKSNPSASKSSDTSSLKSSDATNGSNSSAASNGSKSYDAMNGSQSYNASNGSNFCAISNASKIYNAAKSYIAVTRSYGVKNAARGRLSPTLPKRTIDDVLKEHGAPKKSAKVYDRAWTAFVSWLNENEIDAAESVDDLHQAAMRRAAITCAAMDEDPICDEDPPTWAFVQGPTWPCYGSDKGECRFSCCKYPSRMSRKRDCSDEFVSSMRANGQLVWRRVDGSVIDVNNNSPDPDERRPDERRPNKRRPDEDEPQPDKDKPHTNGAKEGKGISIKPEEIDYILYFDYLFTEKKLKSSTIWSTYSRLNSTHKWRYGQDLDRWPRLKSLLKNFESGYVPKQASAFTKEQIQTAMMIPLDTPDWIMKKAIIAIFYCGGLRGIELRTLTAGSTRETSEGIWINHKQAKTRGADEWKNFLVPWNHEVPNRCFATRVRNYLVLLNDSLGHKLTTDGPLFRKATRSGYSTQVIGEKTFAKIPKEVASILNLDRPETYTTHGFRRASATEAADRGATTIDMKRMYGWKNEATPMRYIKNTKENPRKMAQLLAGPGASGPTTSSTPMSGGNSAPTSGANSAQTSGATNGAQTNGANSGPPSTVFLSTASKAASSTVQKAVSSTVPKSEFYCDDIIKTESVTPTIGANSAPTIVANSAPTICVNRAPTIGASADENSSEASSARGFTINLQSSSNGTFNFNFN